MTVYEVRTDAGKVYRMSGEDGEHASRRVADLHGVTAVAHRPSRDPRDAVGVLTSPADITG